MCKCCQVKSYTFTDCHSQVLYLLSKNISQNLGSGKNASELGGDSMNRERKMLRRIRRQLSQSSDGGVPGECYNEADLDSITKLADSDQVWHCP